MLDTVERSFIRSLHNNVLMCLTCLYAPGDNACNLVAKLGIADHMMRLDLRRLCHIIHLEKVSALKL